MMLLKRFRTVLCIFLWMPFTSGAMAQDLVLERSILDDPSGQMSLAQVMGSAFTPTNTVTPRIFDRSVFWLRLQVNAPQVQEPLAFVIQPIVDKVTLFTPPTETASDWVSTDMSTSTAMGQALASLAPGQQTVYLRVDTRGVLVKVSVQLQRDLRQQRAKSHFVLGLVAGTYALPIALMLCIRSLRRSSLTYFLLFHALVCLLYELSIADLSAFSANLAYWPTNLARPLSVASFLSFGLLVQSAFGFLAKPQAQRWVLWLYGGSVFWLAVVYAIEPAQLYRFVIFAGASASLFLNCLLIAEALKFVMHSSRNQLGQICLSLTIVLILLIINWAMLQLTGVLPMTSILLSATSLRPLFFAACLLSFYQIIHSAQADKLNQSQLTLGIAQSQRKLATQHLQEQAEFAGMLLHELKTPIYTIQLAGLSLQQSKALSQTDLKRLENIVRSVDDLSSTVNHWGQADAMARGVMPVNKRPVSIAALLNEVAQLPGAERIDFSGQLLDEVLTDLQYARIVLVDLVNNALMYSRPDSRVTVDVKPDLHAAQPSLSIIVTNEVGNAGKPDAQKVFSQHDRSSADEKVSSLGLGLWLAQSVALRMGSVLKCTSGDSTVYFHFSLERC